MCETCELHKTYLERIISLQNDQIEYLKSLQSSKTNLISYNKKTNEMNNSIFDIIDHNIEELNINSFMKRIEYKYPARDTLIDIIDSIITHVITKWTAAAA